MTRSKASPPESGTPRFPRSAGPSAVPTATRRVGTARGRARRRLEGPEAAEVVARAWSGPLLFRRAGKTGWSPRTLSRRRICLGRLHRVKWHGRTFDLPIGRQTTRLRSGVIALGIPAWHPAADSICGSRYGVQDGRLRAGQVEPLEGDRAAEGLGGVVEHGESVTQEKQPSKKEKKQKTEQREEHTVGAV